MSVSVFTYAGSSRCMSRMISGICDFVCLAVCVCTLKGKRLELSTANFVHIYSMAGHRHALTLRSNGQMSRSQRYEVLVCCRRGSACPYDSSGFWTPYSYRCVVRRAVNQ